MIIKDAASGANGANGANETNRADAACINFYLTDVLYYNNLPYSLNTIFQSFFRNRNLDNILIINGALKKRMVSEVGLSVASIDRALTQFVKAGLLLREDTGMYLFNPIFFDKNILDDVQEISIQVTYDEKGRNISNLHVKSNNLKK